MRTIKTFFTLVYIIIGTIYSLLLWILQSIADFFKDQVKYTSIKMRKDENNAQTTINPSEIELYSKLTDWWDPNGVVKPLHNMNSVRVPFIKDGLLKSATGKNNEPLKGIKILDVGCGGGFLSEIFAKFGASITGIDACEVLIKIAEAHKHLDPELEDNKPTYIATTVEEHITQYRNHYDALIASEVLDHVSNPEFFVISCIKAVKPGGKIFFTAPNRTWITRFGLIFYPENVIKILPKGTHHNENFVTPEELSSILEKNGCRVEAVQGFFYNFLNNTWFFINRPYFIYGLQATKIE